MNSKFVISGVLLYVPENELSKKSKASLVTYGFDPQMATAGKSNSLVSKWRTLVVTGYVRKS